MAWLVALDGGLAGKKFPLDATFLVGRGPFNHVVLDDVRISRQHAKVSPEAGGHVVYDLNSANGTFVNDEPVTRHRLAPGDLVRFGPFRFRFEADPDTDMRPRMMRRRTSEELTRPGFDPPTKIVGETDAQVPRTLIMTGGLADLEQADRRLRTLFAFVQSIATTLDSAELLDRISEGLLDAFPSGMLAVVYLLDAQTDTMDPQRVKARDKRVIPHPPLPAELYMDLVQRGKAVLSAPMSLAFEDEEGASSGLAMHAPMVYRGRVVGILNVRCDPGSGFSQGDLDLLTAIASHAALAQESSKLHQASLAQQRMQRDLNLAQEIQKSFLPSTLPTPTELSFVAEYRPAYSVGGDFYDVFWQSKDRIGCVIGDVSGKGVAAALLMARVSSDLRTALITERGPAAALSRVNREVVARGQHDIFVTAVALSIHVPTRTVTLANAGHLPPYVRRADEGELIRFDDATSCPLGLFDVIGYEQADLRLFPGDTLVLTTDGIQEATSERGEQFGFGRLETALAHGPPGPEEIAARLLGALRTHVGAAPQYDDLTLLLCGAKE